MQELVVSRFGLLFLLLASALTVGHAFVVRPMATSNSRTGSSSGKFNVFHQHITTETGFEALKNNLCSGGNTTQLLINLIRLGEQWSDSRPDTAPDLRELSHAERIIKSALDYSKVTGCMACVYVKTSLQTVAAENSEDCSISVDGVADSKVAGGLLGVIATGLRGQSAASVLQIDADTLSNEFEFDQLLPRGRLNGFTNILRLVQCQIREQISVRKNTSSRRESTDASQRDDPRKDEIAVLLSGGVDSSVALKLLLEAGHRVRCYYLKIWLEDELAHLNECPWEDDLRYCEQVCTQLGVPLETLSLQREYWAEVVQYTLREARLGLTPNPDVMCNSRVKFGVFARYVGKYHSKIASGHYAQVVQLRSRQSRSESANLNDTISDSMHLESNSNVYVDALDADVVPVALSECTHRTLENERVAVMMSPDLVKDQSYFLCALSQQQLSQCVFPIGHLQKTEVRELAQRFNLPTKNRKDSQGICFLGKLKFEDFIKHYLGENSGPIRCYETNALVGEHHGLWYHTIGQRKGIGLLLHSGHVHAGPWFVASKDVDSNTLFVTNNLDTVQLPRTQFAVGSLNWFVREPIGLDNEDGVLLDLKLRHGPTLSRGYVRKHQIGDGGARVQVRLLQRDKGIAPGQFAAFYQKNVCLGAGVIVDTATDDCRSSRTMERENPTVDQLSEVERVSNLIEVADD